MKTVILTLASAALAGAAFAQTAPIYRSYGAGCDTSIPEIRTCASLNSRGGTLDMRMPGGEYCYGVRAKKAMTVTGFSLYTRSKTFATTVRCALYLPGVNGLPSATPAAKGVMGVGSRPAFYTTAFGTAVHIGAGQVFWISQLDTTSVALANLRSGTLRTTAAYYRNTNSRSGWRYASKVRYPAWRVQCRAGAVPKLAISQLPYLGRTVTWSVSPARRYTWALFVFGGSRTRWGALQLPFDLGELGAPGCKLLASQDLLFPGLVDVNGRASITLRLPNDRRLARTWFYNQVIVFDRNANKLGIALSQGGEGRFGEG